MNNISSLKIGFTFAGCLLGAGYVSGQELWQFFSSFGKIGYAGLMLSIVLLAVLGYIIMRVAQKSGIREMDRIIISQDLPVLRKIIGTLQTVFIFGIVVIMCAGTGALLHQMFGLPTYLGSAAFCLLVAVLAYRGVTGLVSIMSTLVPILVVFTVIICCIAICRHGVNNLTFPQAENRNPLLSVWTVAAVTYVTYNLFCGIGILTPLAHLVTSRRKTAIGIIFGTALLWLIATCIFLAMASYPESTAQELPMLTISCGISSALGYVYSVLLLFGMLGAALSNTVAILTYAGQKLKHGSSHRLPIIIILVAVAWLCSLFGFGDLISVVYPVCGYFGCFALLMVVLHYIQLKFKHR